MPDFYIWEIGELKQGSIGKRLTLRWILHPGISKYDEQHVVSDPVVECCEEVESLGTKWS